MIWNDWYYIWILSNPKRQQVDELHESGNLSIFIIILKNNVPSGILNKILSLSFSSFFNIQVNLIFHQWNLHFAVVHMLNGLLRSAAVLYKGIVWGDEKSVGTGPRRVVVVAPAAAVVAVDVERGIYTTRPSGNICIFLANDDDETDWKVPLCRVLCVCVCVCETR